MFGELLQPMHLLLILVIALLVFGPGKLPQIAANLGKSIREFKGALSTQEEITIAPPAQQPAQAQPAQAPAQEAQQAAQPQAAQSTQAAADAPKQEQKSV